MRKIVNLTPHDVDIYIKWNDDWRLVKRYPSVGVARVIKSSTVVEESEGVEVVKYLSVRLLNLPPASNDVRYIVSHMTAEAAVYIGRETYDLLTIADSIRNEHGKVIGCRRLAQVIDTS